MFFSRLSHPLLLLLLFTGPLSAVEKSSPIGKRITAFELADYLGTKHTLQKYAGKKVVVVAFLGTECPLARHYGRRLGELARKYRTSQVQFIGINSNQHDSLKKIGKYVKDHSIEFPLLKDPANKVAALFGAVRTPEVFVLDAKRTLQYTGRIDDQYGVTYQRPSATKTELVDAIDSLLAGKPVKVAVTKAVGCHIATVVKRKPSGKITYAKHVSRILQKYCVDCHRAGQVAPFTLTSFEDAVAWRETILEVIEDKRMPPWHAKSGPERFHNAAIVSPQDLATLRKWVENGSPQGDLKDLPQAKRYVPGWQIGRPHKIYKMPRPFRVPAKGVVQYKYFRIDPEFKEDMWVARAEARPGNPAVVHHIILFFIPPGRKYHPADALFNSVAAFAPGMPAPPAMPGYARRIPAGSKLYFQVHYTPNGTAQPDLSEAGLVFIPKDQVKVEMKVDICVNPFLRIPPHASNHRATAERGLPSKPGPFKVATTIHSLVPHMHLRGKSFRFEARLPNGKKWRTLLDVPRYDFNWQNVYYLKKPETFPAGTRLRCVAHYDNSSRNLSNPDPNQTVRWGDQTWEEMLVGSFMTSIPGQDLTKRPKYKKNSDGTYRVDFQLALKDQVKSVHVAGTFNNWDQSSHPMKRDAKGVFRATLQSVKGAFHEYKFVVVDKKGKLIWRRDPGSREFNGYYRNSVLRLK